MVFPSVLNGNDMSAAHSFPSGPAESMLAQPLSLTLGTATLTGVIIGGLLFFIYKRRQTTHIVPYVVLGASAAVLLLYVHVAEEAVSLVSAIGNPPRLTALLEMVLAALATALIFDSLSSPQGEAQSGKASYNQEQSGQESFYGGGTRDTRSSPDKKQSRAHEEPRVDREDVDRDLEAGGWDWRQ